MLRPGSRFAALAGAAILATTAQAAGDVRILTFGVEGCILKLMPGRGVTGSAVVREWSLDGSSGLDLGRLGRVGDTVTVPGRRCDIEFIRVSGTQGYEMDLGVIPPSGAAATFHIVGLPSGDRIRVEEPRWSGGHGTWKVQTGDRLHPLISIPAF